MNVVKLTLDSLRETRGHDWFTPDCPISRAVCECKGIGRKKTRPYISAIDAQIFVDQGIKIEYRGRRSEILDKLGATKTDE